MPGYHITNYTVSSLTKRFIPQTPQFESRRLPVRSVVVTRGKRTYFIQMECVFKYEGDQMSLQSDYVVSYTVIERHFWFFGKVIEQTIHSHNFDLQKAFDKEGEAFDGVPIQHTIEYTYQHMEDMWIQYCLALSEKVGYTTLLNGDAAK